LYLEHADLSLLGNREENQDRVAIANGDGAAFIAVYVVPFAKYPANPPSVGNPETIGYRTELYFGMIAIAIVAMIASINLGRAFARRWGNWNASLAGGLMFVGLVGVAYSLMPTINELPDAFPAALTGVSWTCAGSGGGACGVAAGTGDADIPVTEILTFGADGTTPTTTMWWLALQAPHTGTPLDLLHTTGTAVALLGALLLLGHVTVPGLRRVIDPVLAPLAAAGSMTLTLYTAHIVFMSSPLDDFDAVPGYVLQVVTALLFAVVWRRLVGRGPLETLVTRAAHGAAAAVEGPSGRHGA